jgi:ABC-2 type transport system permease protein
MAAPAGAIGAIVVKDLRLFARDRFYLFVSVLGLAAYTVLFWVLPATAEQTVPLGVHLPGDEQLLEPALAEAGEQGMDLTVYGSAAELETAVSSGEVVAGLDFPPGFLATTAAGGPTTVRLLLSGQAPPELRDALTGLVRESAHQLAGDSPPVTLPDLDEMVLGAERIAGPVPLREQLRPLLIFLVLMTEMFALAALVAAEIAQRTASAVLVTPVRSGDLLAAKALLGTVLAFGQALLLGLVTGGLAHAPALLVVALLLGAVLVTGFGLIAGSLGQDFVAIIFYSVLFFIPMAIPAFALLYPGTPAVWVQAMPTYGLAETLVRASVYRDGWAELWGYLAVLAAWCAAALVAGTLVLGRRVARL